MNPRPSAFRTVESADWPTGPLPGLKMITVKSSALQARVDLTLYVPPDLSTDKKVPLLILLHGVYGSHWAWTVKGRAPQILRQLITTGQIPPMALAMPSDGLWGDGSGYVQHPQADFERWITHEVPQVVAEVSGHIDPSAPLALGGLSMGGFGALYLGAKYPERFFALSGHSSITAFPQLAQFVEEPLSNYGIDPIAPELEVIHWMRRHRDRLPSLRFDCGHDDPLITPNRTLHQQLVDAYIDHTYEEYPGGHSWDYWQTHVSRTFFFIAEHLKR